MSPLSHGELRQMEEAAKNKTAPIMVDYDTIYKELRNDFDEKITQAIVTVGITVNKAELIRALELDKKVRNGELVEVKHANWIYVHRPTENGIICECSLCHLQIFKYDKDQDPHTWNFCSRCGARMDGGKNDEEP